MAIDAWEADSLYPSGHYTRTLGPIGDRDTETEARLRLLHASFRMPRLSRSS